MGDHGSRGRRNNDHYHAPRLKERLHSGQDSKGPLFGNLTWKRETTTDENTLAEALLSRIQQGPTSLLERISPQTVKREPETEHIDGGEDAMDVEDGMMLGKDDSTHITPQPTTKDLKLADLLIASALADATKTAPSTGTDEPVQSMSISESAVSESPTTASADRLQDSTIPSHDDAQAQSGGGDGGVPSKAELIGQAKQLLIPIVTQNARLRDPDADAETIRKRVLSIITDEQCLQFLQIAKSVREQVRSGGRSASPGDKGSVALTHTPQPVAASVPEPSLPHKQPDEIRDPRALEDPVRKQGALEREPVLSVGSSSLKSRPTAEVSSQDDSSSSSAFSLLDMPGPHSPPRAPRAMLQALKGRFAHPDLSPPDAPAALRSLASPYGPAYRRRFSSPPASTVKAPTSPRLLRKTSAPQGNGDPSSEPPAQPPRPTSNLESTPSGSAMSLSLTETSPTQSPIQAENEDGRKSEVGAIIADVPMVVDEFSEELAPVSATEPPPLPPNDSATATDEDEQPHATTGPLTDTQTEVMVPAPQSSDEPNSAMADPVEVNAVTDTPTTTTSEDQSAMVIEPSADVKDPMEDMTEPLPEPSIHDHEENSVIPDEPKETVSSPSPLETKNTALQLPELLHIANGSRIPDVVDIEFEVDRALASATGRWCSGQVSYDASATYASVYLLCLPIAEVRVMYGRVGLTASREDYGNALWNIRTKWPPQGKLMIEINSGESTHCTFIPQQLGPRDGPLEVSKYIQPGKNTLRLIQLADSSAHLFVLLAREPLSRELKWHSLVRSFTSPPPVVAGSSSSHTAPTIAAF